MEICWAAQRSGIYYTAISRYLTEEEIAYIIRIAAQKSSSPRRNAREGPRPGQGQPYQGRPDQGRAGDSLFFMVDEPSPFPFLR